MAEWIAATARPCTPYAEQCQGFVFASRLSRGFFFPFAAAAEGYSENPGTEGDGNFTAGPEYKIDRDLTDQGNAKGKSFEFTMRLADSKIFRGDDTTLEPVKKKVRQERKIFVYVPAAYQDGTEAPVLIIHDGPGQLGLVRHALDNLTISKDPKRQLPAFIASASSPALDPGNPPRLQAHLRSRSTLTSRRTELSMTKGAATPLSRP